MSKRFWLLGFLGLILVALLAACGSTYNSSSNGLVLVGSQGSSVIQTFSLNPNSGHVGTVANSTNDTGNSTCILNGLPAQMVTDPKGTYAYVIMQPTSQCSNSQLGIAVFQIKSDGTTAQVGSLVPDGNPVSLAMDSAGKFLFVAEGAGLVNVYAIGSGGTLTGVPGTFNFVNGQGFRTPNIVAVAPTPTVFPATGINGVNNAVCTISGNSLPTAEYLYAVDSNNYVVWQFSVDMTTGALGNPQAANNQVPSFQTDAIPAGVTVDACDRFVYVSGSLHNKINAYTICTAVIQGVCPNANGTLVSVAGSPFAVTGSANGLGPIIVDPFGNNVYVLGTASNTVSGFKISPVSGAITALSPADIATGAQPKSIVIRADGSWMFITNFLSASVSQYAVTPATGALAAAAPITTDNLPFGVAVK